MRMSHFILRWIVTVDVVDLCCFSSLTCSCMLLCFYGRETIYTLSDYHDSVESTLCKADVLLQLGCQL